MLIRLIAIGTLFLAACAPGSSRLGIGATEAALSGTPTNPRVDAPTSTSGRVLFSWDAGSSLALGYEVTAELVGGPVQYVFPGAARSTTVRLTTNGVYELRVRACRLTDCTPYTAPVTVTVNLTFPDYLSQSCDTIPTAVPAQEAVGAVVGKAGVAGGTATYEIPIVAAPGRRGMEPDISLSYASRSGNGPLGVGWALSGLSRISRCPSTVAQDGVMRPVMLANTDRLCLDGQRLLPVGSGTSGGVAWTEYRTEIDAFRKVVRRGTLNSTATYFEVYAKSGQISYYGGYQGTNAVEMAAAHNVPVSWWLRMARDRQSNSVLYSYTASSGEFVVDKIEYTGVGMSAGDRKITFEYDTLRPDKENLYAMTEVTRLTKRLTGVASWVGSNQVRRYTLEYKTSPATNRLLLASVRECASTTNCLPATLFGYQDSPAIYEQQDLANGAGETTALTLGSDYDGDGTRDYMRREFDAPGGARGPIASHLYLSGDPTHPEDLLGQTWANSFDRFDRILRGLYGASDFDLDGRADQLGTIGGKFAIHSKAGDKRSNFVPSGGWLHTADFDGNGLTDVLSSDAGAPVIALQCAAQSTTVPPMPACAAGELCFCNTATFTVPAGQQIVTIDDFNGDGLPDIFVDWNSAKAEGNTRPSERTPPLEPKIIFTHRNGQTLSFSTSTLASLGAPGSSFSEVGNRGFADFNGDGLPDIYVLNPGVLPQIWVNKGGVFEARAVSGGITMRNAHRDDIMIFDQDGDGRDDILVPSTLPAAQGGQAETWTYSQYDPNEPRDWDSGIDKGDHSFNLDSAPDDKNHAIYYWDAVHFDENAVGEFAVRQNRTSITGAKGRSRADDWFGDGLVDVSYRKTPLYERVHDDDAEPTYTRAGMYASIANPGHKVSRNLGPAPDLLVHAVDAFGDNNWEYQPLSAKTAASGCALGAGEQFYQIDFSDPLDADQFYVASSMHVVARFERSKDYHVGSFDKHCYRYAGGKASNVGRGFLGFKTIIDDQALGDGNDLRTTTRHLQSFPHVGQVEWMSVSRVADASGSLPFQRTDNRWLKSCVDDADGSTPGQICFPYVERVTTVSRDLGDATRPELSRLIKVFGYDAQGLLYGNLSSESVTVLDHGVREQTTSTAHVYAPADTGNWWVDKPSTKTVTVGAVTYTDAPTMTGTSENAPKVVVTSYDFHPDSDPRARLPKSVTLQASSTSERHHQEFLTYDSYGNLTSKREEGSHISGPRTASYVPSSDGYFIETTTNSLNHSTVNEYDAESGAIKRSRDANQIWTVNTLDEFGHVTETTVGTLPTLYQRRLWVKAHGPCEGVVDAKYLLLSQQNGAPIVITCMDHRGRAVQTMQTAFDGTQLVTTSKRYNARGQLIAESQPDWVGGSYETLYQKHDALGRVGRKVVSKTGYYDAQFNPDESFTVDYVYSGLTTSITLDEKLTASRTYDSTQHLVRTVDTDDKEVLYRHDGLGKAILIQDPAGNRLRTTFNNLGHVVSQKDPNRGSWEFGINPLGELYSQTDARGMVVEYPRDRLGRVTSRAVNGTTEALWFFDGAKAGLPDKEQVVDAAGAVTFERELTYDAMSRVIKTTSRFDNKSYELKQHYDCNGALGGHEYPNREALEYKRSAYGHVQKELDPLAPGAPFVYRDIQKVSPRGAVEMERYGNNLFGKFDYFASTGQLRHICVGETAACIKPRQKIDYYYYDPYGNLTNQAKTFDPSLTQAATQVWENFGYDNLQRLKTSDRVWSGSTIAPVTVSYGYDALGNLKTKDDYATNYLYGTALRPGPSNAGPNAVRSISKVGGPVVSDFRYDANGNLIEGDGRTIAYSTFNKPTQIVSGGVTTTFDYDPSGEHRYRQESAGKITRYIGGVFEEVTEGGVVEERVYAGAVALVTRRGGAANHIVTYLHKDRLGSTDAITNTDAAASTPGVLIEAHGFDAFGSPRNSLWESRSRLLHSGEFVAESTMHGFTGHEHLDEHQLIHMNGRGYDPSLGRFLSVDPVIVNKANSQSLNAYSYILNNPLSATDPSGYSAPDHVWEMTKKSSATNVRTETVIRTKAGKVVAINVHNGAETKSSTVGKKSEASDYGRASGNGHGSDTAGQGAGHDDKQGKAEDPDKATSSGAESREAQLERYRARAEELDMDVNVERAAELSIPLTAQEARDRVDGIKYIAVVVGGITVAVLAVGVGGGAVVAHQSAQGISTAAADASWSIFGETAGGAEVGASVVKAVSTALSFGKGALSGYRDANNNGNPYLTVPLGAVDSAATGFVAGGAFALTLAGRTTRSVLTAGGKQGGIGLISYALGYGITTLLKD
jgi:RHS repeat-associated protein